MNRFRGAIACLLFILAAALIVVDARKRSPAPAEPGLPELPAPGCQKRCKWIVAPFFTVCRCGYECDVCHPGPIILP